MSYILDLLVVLIAVFCIWRGWRRGLVHTAAVLAGLVLAAMCLTKTLWHYHHLPSNSRLRLRKHYLSATDLQRAISALSDNNPAALAALEPVTSPNTVLQVLVNRDRSLALLQLGRLDTGHFEPASPVVKVVGTEIAEMEVLCR